jgi:AraC-like DNA-binding protein
MPGRSYRPAAPLADLVDCFWLWDDYTAPQPRERALPAGTVDLVINLREDAVRIYDGDNADAARCFPGALVCGAHSRYFVIDTAPRASVMGVHFRPGGAVPFLGVPAGDLCDAHAALEDLWGADARALRERLLEARDPDARFRALERALLARLARPVARHRAVSLALRAFEAPFCESVADVTEKTGLSPRRFIELFRDEVGLTPKLYCRIQRFQDSLRRVGSRRHVPWADLAAQAGYCDQAHFNRDFRAFAGLSPGEYLAQRVERPNHVPLQERRAHRYGEA